MEPAHTSTVSPSFVPRDQREQLMLRFAELVMERGLEQVTLADLAADADVDLASVRSLFASEQDCALALGDAATQQMFSAAGQAFLSTPGDCPSAARAALDAMLRFFAGSPTIVHMAAVVYPQLGQRAATARHRNMDDFGAFLGPGFAAAGELPPQPETVSRIIAGGIYELVSRYYLEGRLEQLPEALPAVTYFTVAPFFGLEQARRVAMQPSPS
jgi:AcrR family transcriptional regulator